MVNIIEKSRITTLVSMLITACVVFLLFFTGISAEAENDCFYTDHVIFTAPSAEKIFDGTPLTEQINVTCQGLPDGFTYKAVAKGSVTYPEDNTEDNNIVTDYIIYDPNGLDVTDKFVNVSLRPGTLKVSYPDTNVLGVKRDNPEDEGVAVEPSELVEIQDEDTAMAATIDNSRVTNIEFVLYGFLFGTMLTVFIIFIVDSKKKRE